jgi:hypothetical protein
MVANRDSVAGYDQEEADVGCGIDIPNLPLSLKEITCSLCHRYFSFRQIKKAAARFNCTSSDLVFVPHLSPLAKGPFQL